MRRVIVAYTLGAHQGQMTVLAGDKESTSIVFARARRQLSFRSKDAQKLGASSFRIISDETQGDL
jgi:hypothetical protein